MLLADSIRPRALLLLVGLVAALLNPPHASEFRPPGYKPDSPGIHALVGAKVVPKPGEVLDPGIIILRDGRIESVGKEIAIPSEARVWTLTNRTIYAGFIDAALKLKSTNSARGLISTSTDFYGVENAVRTRGLGIEIDRVTPNRRALEGYHPEEKDLVELREIGFTAGNVVLDKGIIKGITGLVALSDANPNAAVIRHDIFQQIALDPSGGREASYPRSLMGVIALIRQTLLDAQFQARSDSVSKPFSPALDALAPLLSGARPALFEPRSALMVDRIARLAAEFQLKVVQLSSGQEWRRPELARDSGSAFIVPLDFPELPKLPDEDDWTAVSLDQLRAWDWAPENPALLRREGIEIALTTHGLSDRKDFRKNLRLALDRGLSEEDALAALTLVPARICGVEDKLGSIEPGKLANLTVVQGDTFFNPTNKVTAVWIEGRPFRNDVPEALSAAAQEKSASDPATAAREKSEREEKEKKEAERRALITERIARSPLEGRGPLRSPRAVLVRGATVWTSGPRGRLEEADVLFEEGKVKAVGSNLSAPPDCHVIDASGQHLTPGLIDCHSHSMILHSVNEMALPSSAMARVADVVNSETRNIERQLAGGLTVANLLHGSANPIGGQNCVIKLRDGAPPEALKLDGAPAGIKFALGENVKQANWGHGYVTRFPQSRTGVPVFLRNRFQAARAYMAERKADPDAVPRDLELEAIGEILEGRRLIHCHSYRQDEIIAFLRVMESFGVRVATLQHVLEGYKVADEIAAHGAGASCFSDWWAYKYEVIDAIPYAASLMRERGVLVSLNSDSSDLARRLNLEAAKAVKYGGMSEIEALNLVTINPARQLGIDNRVGSLEPGKDADFALWSKSPLDSTTVCLETWIDRKQYFDRARIPERTRSLERERSRLLAKAKKVAGLKIPEEKPNEEAESAFFKLPLELLHEGEDRHCDDL